MKLEGSVALVVGADSAVGAAIVQGLLARDAVKVYASSKGGSGHLQPGSVPLFVDLARPAYASALARELADVTLLVNCLVAVHCSTSTLAGADIQPPDRRSPPVGRTLNLVDAFAPVLAANGGGAVVNVLSVLCADQHWDDTSPKVDSRIVDWSLGNGLRDRLLPRRTQSLYFRAHLAVGSGDRLLDDQRALAGHLATRVLDQIEAGGGPAGNNGLHWPDETRPVLFRAGRR